jgi:hypothetical protein
VQSLQAVLAALFPAPESGGNPDPAADGGAAVTVYSLPPEQEHVFPNTKPCPRLAHLYRQGEEAR